MAPEQLGGKMLSLKVILKTSLNLRLSLPGKKGSRADFPFR
jgi:hypothetical protein